MRQRYIRNLEDNHMTTGNETPCNCLPANTFPYMGQLFGPFSDGVRQTIVGDGNFHKINFTTIVVDNIGGGFVDPANNWIILNKTGVWGAFGSLQVIPPPAPPAGNPGDGGPQDSLTTSNNFTAYLELRYNGSTADRDAKKIDFTTSTTVAGLFYPLKTNRPILKIDTANLPIELFALVDDGVTMEITNAILDVQHITNCLSPATAPLLP